MNAEPPIAASGFSSVTTWDAFHSQLQHVADRLDPRENRRQKEYKLRKLETKLRHRGRDLEARKRDPNYHSHERKERALEELTAEYDALFDELYPSSVGPVH